MSNIVRVLTGDCAFIEELEDIPNATVLHSEAVPGRDRTAQMSQPGLLGNSPAALILLKKTARLLKSKTSLLLKFS